MQLPHYEYDIYKHLHSHTHNDGFFVCRIFWKNISQLCGKHEQYYRKGKSNKVLRI